MRILARQGKAGLCKVAILGLRLVLWHGSLAVVLLGLVTVVRCLVHSEEVFVVGWLECGWGGEGSTTATMDQWGYQLFWGDRVTDIVPNIHSNPQTRKARKPKFFVLFWFALEMFLFL